MLESLKMFFEGRLAGAGEVDGETPTHAVELATAALLVEMQRADTDAGVEEDAEIRALLVRHFHLDEQEVERFVELAHQRADRSISLHEFTRLLHEHFSVAQKTTVMEMLWRVALADGRLDAHEDHLLRKIADLLYLPPAASARARDRAEGRTG